MGSILEAVPQGRYFAANAPFAYRRGRLRVRSCTPKPRTYGSDIRYARKSTRDIGGTHTLLRVHRPEVAHRVIFEEIIERIHVGALCRRSSVPMYVRLRKGPQALQNLLPGSWQAARLHGGQAAKRGL